MILTSFASSGREDYRTKLLRLLDSALLHWKGEYLIYSPDHWLREYKGIWIRKGWPGDPNIPYQFKIALIDEARKLDDKVCWLDSGMVILKDLTPLFNGITVFHNLGHPLKNYIADHAVELLGFPDINISQIWGGALFFDFSAPGVNEIFEQIKEYSLNGSFNDGGSSKEGFIAHRHDQAVMSVLLHGRCNMLEYGNIVCPPHDVTKEYGDPYLVSK